MKMTSRGNFNFVLLIPRTVVELISDILDPLESNRDTPSEHDEAYKVIWLRCLDLTAELLTETRKVSIGGYSLMFRI